MDNQPVAMAHSLQQLAAILQLSEVRLLGADSKQPLVLDCIPAGDAPAQQQQQLHNAAGIHGDPAAGSAEKSSGNQVEPTSTALAPAGAEAAPAAAGTPAERQQQANSGAVQDPMQQQQQQQQQPQQEAKPELTLTLSKPLSVNASKTPCHAAMLMVDVWSPAAFVHGPCYKVLYCWSCGKDSGGKKFCRQHATARINLHDRWVVLILLSTLLQDNLQSFDGKRQSSATVVVLCQNSCRGALVGCGVG